MLIALAVNGPMTVREAGRSIGSDSHAAYNIARRLVASGLVVKRDREGGRKYLALNRQLRAFRALEALLKRMGETWEPRRVETMPRRWYMDFDDGAMTEARLSAVFNSPVRSRVLLFVACVGRTDMTLISDLLGLNGVSVLYAVNHWEREGVVLSRTVARRRLVSLDPSYEFAVELRKLLKALLHCNEEYAALKIAGKRAMSKVDE